MSTLSTIGFIGVGVMGEPICRHLAIKSGMRVIAHDRDLQPLQRLASHGVSAVTMKDIAEQADIIFMSLPSGAIVDNVVRGDGDGANGLLAMCRRGQILVDLSTSPVELTKALARDLEQAGILFADAPVMRTRAAAEAGTLAVPVGAQTELFLQLEPLLRTFAADVIHAGAVSTGQVVKILNNMVLYETVLALSEARAIGVRAGVEPDRLFSALSVGSADSFALRNHGMKAIAPQQFPEKAFPVVYAKKDLQYAVDLSEQVGVDATGAKNLIACFDKAIAAGHGDKYAPAISLVFEGK
ncbi:2-hydroxy-3-oxopropionate reductase [Pollutimonas nitritireducens]|uniref:2-hydroxy-3-oxopropionate reductase n=1 Tax=Pollutimonas nitritireducens TaxID=2045209 RepID=A0A2N4UCG2_9BURK|nr:NAD(P)-dependent oxidoreductase [Pollutimonas nitritireducens]PLC52710.1 2-hydroxy-3-oxopropionate reductase [Pollutimonas nitritireducens]